MFDLKRMNELNLLSTLWSIQVLLRKSCERDTLLLCTNTTRSYNNDLKIYELFINILDHSLPGLFWETNL